jgi:hypothetical protein
MSEDDTATPAGDRQEPEPGERGPRAAPLARPPGDRYARPPEGVAAGEKAPGLDRFSRGAALAVMAAVAGGALTLLLGGLDVGVGLLAVAAATGWLVGLALAWAMPAEGPHAGRVAGAAVIAALGIAGGLLADGVRALAEGGVLSPPAYAWERYGVLAVILPLVAAAAAAIRAR